MTFMLARWMEVSSVTLDLSPRTIFQLRISLVKNRDTNVF